MKLQISREELSYWHLWLTARVESKLLIIILTDVASFYILLTETTVSCTTLPVKHYATVNHLTIDEIVQHSICKMHNSWLPWNISYTPKKLETFFFVEMACEWFIHLWPCIYIPWQWKWNLWLPKLLNKLTESRNEREIDLSCNFNDCIASSPTNLHTNLTFLFFLFRQQELWLWAVVHTTSSIKWAFFKT